MKRNNTLVLIDTVVIVCGVAICFLVLRYLRREFDGAERVFAYLMFISIFGLLARGLHSLLYRRFKKDGDEDQGAVKE